MSNIVESRVYSGDPSSRHETRGLPNVDLYWSALGMESVDAQFSNQLELALSQGRNEFNFLDLGSGDNASLLRQIVNDKGDRETSRMGRTRQLLEGNPDFTIHAIGLTDATSPESFLEREPIKPAASYALPHPTDGQIQVEKVQYSLTPTQSLDRFLEEVGMKELDLVSATMIFPYLNLDIFRRDVTAIINALRPDGGTLLSIGFVNGEKATREVDEEIFRTYRSEFATSPEGLRMRKTLLMEKIVAKDDIGERYARQDIITQAAEKSDRQVDVAFYDVNFTVVKK